MKIFYFFSLLLFLAGCAGDEHIAIGGDPVSDKFVGSTRQLILGEETSGFASSSFTLVLEAPDGTTIRRDGIHRRLDGQSHLDLSTGLTDGTYRLLYFEYPITDNPELADLADSFKTTQFGLGSRIEVKGGNVAVLDYYDDEIGLPGRGTEEEPYEITSYHSLITLARLVNSEDGNTLITADTHFRQTGKIDMYQASREIDRRYGWLPIGANPALPFRGHYHGDKISTLLIDRPNSAAVGLFGYVHDASFDNISLSNSSITGNYAVGGIAGASMQSGSDRGMVMMTDCNVGGCEITGSPQSVDVGGLIGAIDMQSRGYFQKCTSEDNIISAAYNAGGIIGGSALYSSIGISNCINTSRITTEYSGAGGIVGTCDTIQAAASSNSGVIAGATAYTPAIKDNSGIGAGGIAGGVGTATITSCSNYADISGYAGVGGLVGSSRIKGSDTEAYMYNNVLMRYCFNRGNISGTDCIGGLTGEAQAGTYAVYNKGRVAGSRYVAGIVGSTSIAVVHNAINTGEISGADYVAGIVGKTQFGSLALDHNYGSLSSTGKYLGGITSLAGNNTIIHYCGNFAPLSCTGNGPVGGIVGEIGDPRKWTAMNITECVIGSMEIVMGVVGPVMAVSGHAIEALSHTLEISLHITEVLTDAGLLVADTVLWGIGVAEMVEGEEMEEMKAEITEEVNTVNNEIKREMAALRRNAAYSVNGFDGMALSGRYQEGIESTLNYYESDGGDIKFNEAINVMREEREEQLEKTHKTNEIVHQVVGGVCIVVGTVAAIGGVIASGGAAAPFVVAGAAASIAGGLNALTKTATEFQENVAIISQCINTGDLNSKSAPVSGGLVGRLNDNCIMRDCLVTGKGPGANHGSPFVCDKGHKLELRRLISLSDLDTWTPIINESEVKSAVVWGPNLTVEEKRAINDRTHLTVAFIQSDITNPKSYSIAEEGWDVGGSEKSLWVIPDSPTAFPVPAWSEMRE